MRARRSVIAALFLATACGGAGKKTPAVVPEPAGENVATAEPGSTGHPLPCAERDGGPTRAQCTAVVDRLNGFMAEEMNPDRGKDVCECLELDRELISCLETSETREDTDRCVENVAPGWEKRELCERAMTRLDELDPEFEATDEVLEACMDEADPAELECLAAAATLEAAKKC